MADPAGPQHVIVLTGTGANAAYEVGVLQALLREKGGPVAEKSIEPYGFCGTSIGALNAAIMTSRSRGSIAAAADHLAHVWLDRIAVARASSATGFFRIRVEPTQYLDLSLDVNVQMRPFFEMTADALYFARQTMQRLAYALSTSGTVADGAATLTELSQWVDVSPMVSLINDVITPADLALPSARLAVTALNWRTGQPRTFRNEQLSREYGRDILLAAMALPGVFPPRQVEGIPYVEASALMDTPLAPAIALAAGGKGPIELHVVYVDASITDVPLPPLSNTFATAYRLFMLAVSRQVNNDIRRAEEFNRQLFMKSTLEDLVSIERGTSALKSSDAMAESLGQQGKIMWNEFTRQTARRRPVIVHRYRPTKNVYGFDLAQFERGTIQQLIDDGYEDAMNHDCDSAGCVKILPASQPGPLALA